MLRKINLNQEKKSCSLAGARTHITSNYTKPRDFRPKCYNHCTLQIWAIKSCHYNPSLNERFCHKNKIVIKWKLSDKYLEAALGTSMDLNKSIKTINLLGKTAIFGAL